jgi:hypothetical protein
MSQLQQNALDATLGTLSITDSAISLQTAEHEPYSAGRMGIWGPIFPRMQSTTEQRGKTDRVSWSRIAQHGPRILQSCLTSRATDPGGRHAGTSRPAGLRRPVAELYPVNLQAARRRSSGDFRAVQQQRGHAASRSRPRGGRLMADHHFSPFTRPGAVALHVNARAIARPEGFSSCGRGKSRKFSSSPRALITVTPYLALCALNSTEEWG